MVVDERYGFVSHEGCDHIFFVGFLGVGKSTLARNLGGLFHRSYVDTDRMAERIARKSVAQMFAEDGEQEFRRVELAALERLLTRKSLLVSCGGGIVETPRCRELMGEMGSVVFLDGDLEDSLRQIQHPEKRPDLGSYEESKALLEHRRPLYEQVADFQIDIRGKTFDQVASEAGQLLWEAGLL